MTSRFREELALRRPDGPERVGEAVSESTVATAGRAVFFSGLTVLLGLLGPRPVRVHDPALGRHRRRDRRRPGGRRGADAAAGDPGPCSAPGSTASRSGRSRPTRRGRTRGRGSPAASCATRSRSSSRRSACCSCSGRRSCTSGSTRPTPRSCRRERARRGRRSTDSAANFGEGEFAPIVLAIRTTGPATTRPTSPPCTTTRAASRPIRGSLAVDSLVDVDPRLTLDQYQLLYARPDGPRDRYVQTALAATTKGDLTAFTSPRRTARTATRAGARRGPPRDRTGPLAPPAGVTCPRRRRARPT